MMLLLDVDGSGSIQLPEFEALVAEYREHHGVELAGDLLGPGGEEPAVVRASTPPAQPTVCAACVLLPESRSSAASTACTPFASRHFSLHWRHGRRPSGCRPAGRA